MPSSAQPWSPACSTQQSWGQLHPKGTERCRPVSWLGNTVGMPGMASFPATQPGTEQGAFSALGWARQRAPGQGKLLGDRTEPWVLAGSGQ